MVKLIESATRIEAWMEATKFLLDSRSTINLSLAIESPGTNGPYRTADQCLDRFFVKEQQLPLHSVAETIFPGYEYQRRGSQGVFKHYPEEVYPAISKHPQISWGTYAYRLLRRQGGEGKMVNPLKQMIEKMHVELRTVGPKRSCYEMGIAEGEYDLPIYSAARDATRHMGGPCLSHLSFKLFTGAIHLTAMYRSHDYAYKVPGNLLGLARLQSFVARETGQALGSLVVHSTYAFLGGTKGPLRLLLDEIEGSLDKEEQADDLAH